MQSLGALTRNVIASRNPSDEREALAEFRKIEIQKLDPRSELSLVPGLQRFVERVDFISVTFPAIKHHFLKFL